MRKQKRFWAQVLILAMLASCMLGGTALAYFDRGTVGISAARSSVSLDQGGDVSVSVTLSPASQDQLPGCGMAECPQSCGEKECLNENGECQCGGLEYTTYYTNVVCSSSNSAVATASYENGAVTIHGVQAGTAVITLTAKLRQYTDGATSIAVTVSSASSGGSSDTGGSSSGTSGGASSSVSGGSSSSASGGTSSSRSASSGGTAVVTPGGASQTQSSASGATSTITVIGGDSAAAASSSSSASSQADTGADSASLSSDAGSGTDQTPCRIVESKGHGTYEIVNLDLIDGDVATYLRMAKENGYTVTFQKLSGDNVVYSWSFDGSALTSTDSLDLGITLSGSASGDLAALAKGTNAAFLTFACSGTLPAPAEVYLRVSDYYADGTCLTLYYVNEQTGQAETAAENLTVENGYVSFTLDHCSQYFLTDGTQAETGAAAEQSSAWFTPAVGALIAAGAAAAAAAGVFVYRKKHAGGGQ